MKIDWKTCFRVGVTALIFYLCISFLPGLGEFAVKVLGAASPIFIGGSIAFVLNILMSFYERHIFKSPKKKFVIAIKRPVSILLAFLTLAVIIAAVLWLILPQFISAIEMLIQQLPTALTNIVAWFDKTDILSEDVMSVLSGIDFKTQIEKVVSAVTGGVGDFLGAAVNIVTSVFSGVVTTFLSIIFSVYILFSKEKLAEQINRTMGIYLKSTWYDKIQYVLKIANRCFHNYISGQCIEALILGVLCMVGMFIFRLPYAPMISALIAFTALIPIAGAYIGAIVGAFLIFMVSPIKALIFLIFIIVLQQIEGNLIYPKVVGSKMGLPAIWVLASVTIGGGILGVLGMLLGVPIAATIYYILQEDVRKKSKIE